MSQAVQLNTGALLPLTPQGRYFFVLWDTANNKKNFVLVLLDTHQKVIDKHTVQPGDKMCPQLFCIHILFPVFSHSEIHSPEKNLDLKYKTHSCSKFCPRFMSVKEMHIRHFLVKSQASLFFLCTAWILKRVSRSKLMVFLLWCNTNPESAASGVCSSGIHSGAGTERVSRTDSWKPLTTGTTKWNPEATYICAWGCSGFFLSA